MASLAAEGAKSVIGIEFSKKAVSATDRVAPADKIGLAGMGPSETPVAATKADQGSADVKNGKNGDGLGGEWEVVSERDKSDTDSDKSEKSSKLEGAIKEAEKTMKEGQKQIAEEENLETMSQSLDPEGKKIRRTGFQRNKVEEPGILNLPRKAKKLAKVSMEAMIRGFEKFTEEEEKHTVAAWHNAIRP